MKKGKLAGRPGEKWSARFEALPSSQFIEQKSTRAVNKLREYLDQKNQVLANYLNSSLKVIVNQHEQISAL